MSATIAAQRAAVVAEAMTWLRTPWHHRGSLKGVGVDCAQFVLRVYVNCGLCADVDTGEYPRDWHVHKTEERFLAFVPDFAREIGQAEAQPGDLMLVRIGRVFSHGVIILDWPQGIHAAIREGMVTLVDIERDSGLAVPRKFFTHKDW